MNVGGTWHRVFMSLEPIATEAEQILKSVTAAVLAPAPRECLACFVNRQLEEFGCNHSHRFSVLFRDQRAPGATALHKRLSAMGACCCDCEIFMNAYEPAPNLWVTIVDDPALPPARGGYYIKEPETMPPCNGVRRGSAQPCSNWQRQRRYR